MLPLNVDTCKFEPGRIMCAECGHRPEDGWDPSPEGFFITQAGDVYCEDCSLAGETDEDSKH